jgi:hypothetical protein
VLLAIVQNLKEASAIDQAFEVNVNRGSLRFATIAFSPITVKLGLHWHFVLTVSKERSETSLVKADQVGTTFLISRETDKVLVLVVIQKGLSGKSLWSVSA